MAPAPQVLGLLAQSDRRERIAAFFRAINRLPDYVTGIGIGGIIVTVLIQILSRWAGRPVAWTEEGTRFLFVWIVFLGIGAGFRKAESARVTIFLTWMPRPLRQASIWIYAVSTIGFFALMAVTGSQLVWQQVRGNELGSALMIPMWIVGICVPVSAAMGILGVIESMLLNPELVRIKED